MDNDYLYLNVYGISSPTPPTPATFDSIVIVSKQTGAIVDQLVVHPLPAGSQFNGIVKF